MKESQRIQYEARLLRRISALNHIPMTALKIEEVYESHHGLSVQFTAKKDKVGYCCNVGLDQQDMVHLMSRAAYAPLDYKLNLSSF